MVYTGITNQGKEAKMNTTTEIQDQAFEARVNGNMSHEDFIAVTNLLSAIDKLTK